MSGIPLVTPTSLRFGVNVGLTGRGDPAPAEAAVAAENAGFDIVTAADHVGSASPFVVLAAAASVTSRVRLRTYVLDHGFWNPGLLARDVASLDAVSAGRVDLGLGAGHMRHEHEAVGLPFPPYPERLAALAAFIDEVRRRLADPGTAPRPAQARVPVLVGGMTERGLSLAARVADVVALTGAIQVPSAPPGTFRLASTALTDERVAGVRSELDRLGRPAEPLYALLQQVVVDRDPEEAAAALVDRMPGRMTVEEVLDTPFVRPPRAYRRGRRGGARAARRPLGDRLVVRARGVGGGHGTGHRGGAVMSKAMRS